MNDEISNDETNPNDRNDKCPTFNSVIPSEVEESLIDHQEMSPTCRIESYGLAGDFARHDIRIECHWSA